MALVRFSSSTMPSFRDLRKKEFFLLELSLFFWKMGTQVKHLLYNEWSHEGECDPVTEVALEATAIGITTKVREERFLLCGCVCIPVLFAACVCVYLCVSMCVLRSEVGTVFCCLFVCFGAGFLGEAL